LIGYPWEYVFALISAIGSLGTAAALFFLWNQSKQTKQQIHLTQEEVESTLRPWLGIENITRVNAGLSRGFIKNTGRMPAKIVKRQQFFSSTMITQKQLRSGEDISGKVIVFPDQKREIRIKNEIAAYPYIGILIQYEYGKNKLAEIGLVVKYNNLTERFAYKEEFAN
jgi:hypothetical protein